MKKPKNFNLNDQKFHVMECGDGGDASLIYLKPDEETYLYITKRDAKALRRWLDRAIAFLEENK